MAKETKEVEVEVEKVSELEHLILVSPTGHKYEVSVTDEGNLSVRYMAADAK